MNPILVTHDWLGTSALTPPTVSSRAMLPVQGETCR
jgi:hypothetical protein